MKKLSILTLLISSTALAYADSAYTNFQQFDNQVGFGMNSQNGNFNNSQSNGNPNQFSITSLNLEVEKLFDLGLWMDINAGVAQTYTETNMPNNVFASPLGSYPYLQTLNGKFGFNFPITSNFAIVPYISLGKNANLTSYTSLAGTPGPGGQGINVTNDFFYSLGGGIRLEAPINKYVAIYLDQMLVANLDQTNYNIANTPIISASNNQWTTTLGVKVNPWEKLQIGANLFYTNYSGYSQSSINVLNSVMGVGVPSTAFGFQVSAGFTFQ